MTILINTVVTGDVSKLSVPLTIGNVPLVISDTASVKILLVSTDHTKKYMSSPLEMDKNEDGADWASGIIIAKFTSESTAGITYQGKALIEIQVSDPDPTTWFADVNIVRGQIS